MRFSMWAWALASAGLVATCSTVSAAQANVPAPHARSLKIAGYDGELPLAERDGKSFVDVEGLARLTHGSLSFQPGGVTLTLPDAPEAAMPAESAANLALSRDFINAGIAQITTVREWRAALASAIKNGTPVTGDWTSDYRRNAQSQLAMAAAAASTEGDRSALALLRNEQDRMQQLSDRFVLKRKALEFIATTALDDDPQDQQILKCMEGLAGMAYSGQFTNVRACH